MSIYNFYNTLLDDNVDEELTLESFDGGKLKIYEWRNELFDLEYEKKDNIIYVCKNMFDDVLVSKKRILIPHVCNDKKSWGAGFVIPLAKHFPFMREKYLNNDGSIYDLQLGRCHFGCSGYVNIANMIAQTLGGERPLYYNHLSTCMDKVYKFCNDNIINEIIAPAFGSGLAGGDWNVIKELIQDCWIKNGINVVVYYLPNTFPYILTKE